LLVYIIVGIISRQTFPTNFYTTDPEYTPLHRGTLGIPYRVYPYLGYTPVYTQVVPGVYPRGIPRNSALDLQPKANKTTQSNP